jgi:hypothetical protein
MLSVRDGGHFQEAVLSKRGRASGRARPVASWYCESYMHTARDIKPIAIAVAFLFDKSCPPLGSIKDGWHRSCVHIEMPSTQSIRDDG